MRRGRLLRVAPPAAAALALLAVAVVLWTMRSPRSPRVVRVARDIEPPVAAKPVPLPEPTHAPPEVRERLTVTEGRPVPATHVARLRFAGMPVEGACVSGRVVDLVGVPVPGAGVLRISEGSAQVIAVTGDDGTFRAEGQPAGRAALGAVLRARIVGLLVDAAGDELARRVFVEIPSEGAVDGVELSLGFRLDDCVRVRGRVLDEDGRPIVGASASLDRVGSSCGADGRFDLGFAPPVEPPDLGFRAPGHVVVRHERIGEEHHVTMRLMEPGPLAVFGEVRGPDGAPVAGASVWTEGAGVDRRARTDAAGRFSIERLPERLRGRTFALAAAAAGFALIRAEDVATGSRVVLTLPRAVLVDVEVKDAFGTVPQGLSIAFSDGSAAATAVCPTGLLSWRVAPGSTRVTVSAPGFRTHSETLDLLPDEGRRKVSVVLESEA